MMGEKSEDHESAWLDGYRAAYETAKGFRVRVDGAEVDDALNSGARIVVSVLRNALAKFDAQKEGEK